MPLLPIHGHAALRQRLDAAIRRDALPGSLLLHGPLGVGKQRLALWLGQRLLCIGDDPRPCGVCQHCRYALAGTHPDIHWYFPRPRLKSSDVSSADIEDDFREAIGDRLKTGAYAPPPPEDAIFVATIRAIISSAALAPALGARKVYILGDAERMVVQEGAEEAAGAFLKLLEEPPTRATIILTSSEPGALIPTIRSRVVALRVPAQGQAAVDAVLAEPAMRVALAEAGVPDKIEEQRRLAAGAPGALLARGEWADAVARARRMLDAAGNRDRREQFRSALGQGSSKSRGAFSTSLDALTTLLHERMRASADRGNNRGATAAAQALDAVEEAKERATHNVNPQLITGELLRRLEALLA
ncbi:MAG: holB [Gemmatimonadetes bacterium]|nr:holB [Gemmatimonadota bacterium]